MTSRLFISALTTTFWSSACRAKNFWQSQSKSRRLKGRRLNVPPLEAETRLIKSTQQRRRCCSASFARKKSSESRSSNSTRKFARRIPTLRWRFITGFITLLSDYYYIIKFVGFKMCVFIQGALFEIWGSPSLLDVFTVKYFNSSILVIRFIICKSMSHFVKFLTVK